MCVFLLFSVVIKFIPYISKNIKLVGLQIEGLAWSRVLIQPISGIRENESRFTQRQRISYTEKGVAYPGSEAPIKIIVGPTLDDEKGS